MDDLFGALGDILGAVCETKSGGAILAALGVIVLITVVVLLL